jgi:hypothetical protein
MFMTRRRALMTLAAAATTGAGMAPHGLLETTPPVRGWIAAGWRRGLEGIAAAYLGQHGPQSGVTGSATRAETLTQALGQLGIPRQPAAALLASGRGPRLSAAIREDFDRGRTTEVDGWVLSATEVAVALVAWSERGA